MAQETMERILAGIPLVAILRGVTPEEIEAIAAALYAEGIRTMEIPLNSPRPFDSIERMVRALPDDAIVGAGTVTSTQEVPRILGAGGRLVIMPHADPAVIEASKREGLTCIPGITTTTEAFRALAAGADALKIFPAELIGPPVLKAMRTILPPQLRLFPVGGITPERMAGYRAAGADGFGLGSALYTPGSSVAQVRERAALFVRTWSAP